MCLMDDLTEFLETALREKTFEDRCKDGFGFEAEAQAGFERFLAPPSCEAQEHGHEAEVNQVDDTPCVSDYGIIESLGLDDDDDCGEAEGAIQAGADWDIPPPANTWLFRPGWGGFGLSPILECISTLGESQAL